MSHYIPGNPPEDPVELAQFLQDELYAIQTHIDNNKRNYSFKKITASATIGDTPFTFADASAGAITATLKNPSDDAILTVKKIDSSGNAVTVYSTSLIDGVTAVALSSQYDFVTVYWDNSTWWKV